MVDYKPSTSEAVVSPRKRRCRVLLSITEKIMVKNVFQYVYKEEKMKSDTLLGAKPNKRHCARKTSEILGVAVAAVFKVLKNIKNNVTPTPAQRPGPKIKEKLNEFTFSTIQGKVDNFLHNKESTIENKSEEIYGQQIDPLLVDSWPLLSVDRNKNSKPLLITIDATSLKSLQEDHNYTLKAESTEVTSKPLIRCKESMSVAEFQDENEKNPTRTKPPNTNNKSNELILYDYLKQNLREYERIKWTQEVNRRKNRIEELQRKVKILQSRLRRSKEKEEQMKILYKSVKNYIKFSEIDNILSGRFKELCKKVTSNAPKKLDYTPNVIQFTISLYYLSPKAYDFLKKYMDLPHINIIQKYLSSGTYIINLDE